MISNFFFSSPYGTISVLNLFLGLAKTFLGLIMLRLPEFLYDGTVFAWPMVAAGLLLVISGVNYVDLTIRRGGDVVLLFFVHRVSRMRLLFPRTQWLSIGATTLAMSYAVFELIAARGTGAVVTSALLIALMTPVLSLLLRVAYRLPTYFPAGHS